MPVFVDKAKVNNELIYVGSEKYMNKLSIPIEHCKSSGTIIHIASEKEYYGHIVISDKLRDNSKEVIKDSFNIDDLEEGYFLEGYVSRKKQILPVIMEAIERNR